MTDEQRVRERWERVEEITQKCVHEAPKEFHGFVIIFRGDDDEAIGSGTYLERWSAAWEFTEQHAEKIRQLSFDVEHVKKFRKAVGRYCYQHPYTTQTLEIEIPNLQSWNRILARLDAALTELKRGWKEQP